MTEANPTSTALLRRAGALPVVLAHRGGRGPWRENTVEAFAGALAVGADGVELDVRRAADGTLVVHHDPVVPDIGPLHERRADELPGWVPTLGQALGACAGAVVNVEVKNVPGEPGFDPTERVAVEVGRALEAEGTPSGETPPAPAQVIVSSFSLPTLAAATAAGARSVGLLVAPAFDAPAALEEAASLGCAALHPFHTQVTPDLVARAHDAGMAVIAWTVNEPARARALAAAGADGLITDDVAATLSALGRARGGAVSSGADREGGLVRDGAPRRQSST